MEIFLMFSMKKNRFIIYTKIKKTVKSVDLSWFQITSKMPLSSLLWTKLKSKYFNL